MEFIDLKKPRNADLYKTHVDAFNEMRGPRVGDFCRMKDKTLRRFTYNWIDSLQVTAHPDSGYTESFYLGSCGADFSGSLDPSIPIDNLDLTFKKLSGTFWIFDEGIPGPGRGVIFKIPCRVYRQL